MGHQPSRPGSEVAAAAIGKVVFGQHRVNHPHPPQKVLDGGSRDRVIPPEMPTMCAPRLAPRASRLAPRASRLAPRASRLAKQRISHSAHLRKHSPSLLQSSLCSRFGAAVAVLAILAGSHAGESGACEWPCRMRRRHRDQCPTSVSARGCAPRVVRPLSSFFAQVITSTSRSRAHWDASIAEPGGEVLRGIEACDRH